MLKNRPFILKSLLSCACLLPCILAGSANAASYYFDVNGATAGFGGAANGTYSWEGNDWTTVAAGTAATAAWTQSQFARFSLSVTPYTVTVGADESIAGMYLAAAGTSLTINQQASTSGDLNIVSGVQGFLINGSSANLTINAPIVGSGGIENESGGSLFLYGNNSYSGGTVFGNSAGINFNNANSFGTGAFTLGTVVTQGVLANPSAVAPISIANPINVSVASQLIFVSPTAAPVTFSGGVFITNGNLTLTPNNSATKTTISGKITGLAGNNGVIKTGAGKLVLSGANAYGGSTTISAGTLVLGAANTIASSSQVILGAATLDPGGFHHTMSTTTLSITAASTIDYSAGAAELDFASSSALSWTGTINLIGWDPSIDFLRFGTDATGLTSAQLADIEVNGSGLGTATIDPSGFVLIPEPSTVSLALLGGLSAFAVKRRRKA